MLAQYFELHPSFIADVERGNQADNLAPYWAARELIHRLESLGQGQGVQTYGKLKESLMEISIFNEELNTLDTIFVNEPLETENSDASSDSDS